MRSAAAPTGSAAARLAAAPGRADRRPAAEEGARSSRGARRRGRPTVGRPLLRASSAALAGGKRARLRLRYLELGEIALRLGDALDLERHRLHCLLDALELITHGGGDGRRLRAALEPARERTGEREADDDRGDHEKEAVRQVDDLWRNDVWRCSGL